LIAKIDNAELRYKADLKLPKAELEARRRSEARIAAQKRAEKEKRGNFCAKAITLGAGAVAVGYGVDQGLPPEMA